MRLRLAAALALLPAFVTAAEPLPRAVLAEDLRHPPRLEACMLKLYPFRVSRFVGPRLSDDRIYVDYLAIGSQGRSTWRFRSSGHGRFRAFVYDLPGGGSAVGAYTEELDPISEVVPKQRGRAALAVDLTPCAAFLKR